MAFRQKHGFWLPRQWGKDGTMDTVEQLDRSWSGAASTGGRNLQALVADDTPVMAKLMSGTLDRLGFGVEMVPNGKQAVERAENNLYDVILMDIMMPELDGLCATREIRRLRGERGKVPIIAVSTRMSRPEIESYLAVGMTDVIKKPVSPITLGAIFEKHLSGDAAQKRTVVPNHIKTGAIDDLDVVNWDRMHQYGALFKEGMAGIIEDFLRVAPDFLQDLKRAVVCADAGKVRAYAHQLKSTCEVFGAEALSDLAAQLEILADLDSTDGGLPIFSHMMGVFELTEKALRKKLVILQNFG